MTVNEMIEKLINIQKKGHGDAEVISDIISDYGEEEINDCEYDKKHNIVNLRQYD